MPTREDRVSQGLCLVYTALPGLVITLRKVPANKLLPSGKEISPGISLEGMMLKLKLQYFGHLVRRVYSLEKTLMLGVIGAHWILAGHTRLGATYYNE